MTPDESYGILGSVRTADHRASSRAAALETLRERIERIRFPLETSDAEEARAVRREILEQVDDHMLPRLRRLDAPLLVVVGGSTGAGKSTLVNSLARGTVASTGVRRPTTRSPVLVCHPDDRSYFLGEHARTVNPQEPMSVPAESDALPRGMALLDTPDIDSVVDSNRDLANRLIAVADLWLYVTTAARYADAVPWQLLHDARTRGATLMVTLNRMPRSGGRDVREHLAELLAQRGFGQPQLFAVPETTVEDDMLPVEAVKNLRNWLAELAGEDRETVLEQALDGLLEGLRGRVPELARQVERQLEVAAELRDEVDASYAAALARIDEITRDGSLLRGEVMIRWRDFVGTGELVRSLQAQARWWRAGGRRSSSSTPTGGAELESALTDALTSAIRAEADQASSRVAQRWRAHPAGASLLGEEGPRVLEASAALPRSAEEAARNWQDRVRKLVRDEGATKRSVARIISVDLEGLVLVLMVGLFGYTAGDSRGGGGGTVPRRLLAAIFGADSLRTIADKARADLRDRADSVLRAEAARFKRVLDEREVPDDADVTALYRATYSLEVTR